MSDTRSQVLAEVQETLEELHQGHLVELQADPPFHGHVELSEHYQDALADEGLSRFEAQAAAQELATLIKALEALGYQSGEVGGKNQDARKSSQELWAYRITRIPFIQWLQAKVDRQAKEAIIMEAERKALYERIQLTRSLVYAGRDPWTS